MSDSKALLAPVLPQMGEGMITANELVNGTVDVLVPRYSNIAVGDSIRVFFGTELQRYRTVTDSDITNPTMLFQFNESDIPDGFYSVYYKAWDWVGNGSISPIITAIVSRSGKIILPAPVFLDAINGNLPFENIYNNNGTHVHIPSYPKITIGDIVSVSTSVFDSEGVCISESTYISSHTIGQNDIASGFTILIPPSKILLSDGKYIRSFYIVNQENSSDSSISLTAEAQLTEQNNLLDAPYYPDAIMGWLSYENVIDGIKIRVPKSPSIISGNIITLNYNGYDNNNMLIDTATGSLVYEIQEEDVGADSIEFTISNDVAIAINKGWIESFYSVRSKNNILYSASAIAHVDLSNNEALPAPIFTQADNGTIDLSTIEKDNKVSLRIGYEKISAGDIVVVDLYGTDVNGHAVDDATYNSSHVVNDAQAGIHFIDISLPTLTAQAVGDQGVLHAKYLVLHVDSGGISFSQEGYSMIKDTEKSGDELKLLVTTGAPVFDYEAIHVRPYNEGYIKALPGSAVTVYCSAPATFMETESTEYRLTVGVSGYANFHLRSPQTGTANISVINNDDPSQHISGVTVFSAYTIGSGKIKAYANTTGARSDGASPCRIYLVTESISDSVSESLTSQNQQEDDYRPITTVRVSVSGSASIYGYGVQTADILLNSDNSAEIGIVNTVAETVTVTLSLPESSGSVQNISLLFREF
ncbi:hypothetical protein N4G41_00200 [Kosakonia sacchari]|uniref:hypothetical protein n=1 Tax=Kosakonia sacchari TaxID=1158459 RepID=UPI002ACD4254|nr:hypothetical protein [Kosakonia sacchari]MDZ7320059.1 hypothetical protein [Kosakonia sacchari]